MFSSLLNSQAYVYSASLTFYTLLSIVPALALAFGIAKGFHLEEKLETFFLNALEHQEEIAQYLIQFSKNLLNSTKEEIIAGLGVLVLIASVVKLFSNIESAFNFIWKIKKNRPFSKKLVDYVAFSFLAPLLLVLSGAGYHFALNYVREQVDLLSGWAIFAITYAPFAFLSLLFLFLFRFIPHTKVHFFPALIGSLFSTFAVVFFQWVFITFIQHLMNYGVIYGSFAILPSFLIWLNMNWTFILTGCELVYSIQNFRFLSPNSDQGLTPKELIGVLGSLLEVFVTHNLKGEVEVGKRTLQKSSGLPDFMLESGLELLINENWVARSKSNKKYSLNKNPGTIKLATVQNLALGSQQIYALEQKGSEVFEEAWKIWQQQAEDLKENRLLAELFAQ